MRGSKAKNIRKAVKQMFQLDPAQAIYNDWSPPQFTTIAEIGTIKVSKGIPCEMIKTCGRYKYKELKRMYA